MLLHWAMGISRPPHGTGAKGEPVATSARPSVQRMRSPAVASDFEVGLESGKMIGRLTLRAISRTIDSLKAPGAVDRPMRIVALIFSITSASPMLCVVEVQAAIPSAGWA